MYFAPVYNPFVIESQTLKLAFIGKKLPKNINPTKPIMPKRVTHSEFSLRLYKRKPIKMAIGINPNEGKTIRGSFTNVSAQI